MKQHIRITLYLAGAALLATSVSACRHGMQYSVEERSEWMVQKAGEELELSDLQRADLETFKNELLGVRSAIGDNRRQDHDDIMAMLAEPTLDRNRANTIVNRHLETLHTRSPVVIDALGDFYDGLDEEQRAELRALIEHRMDRREGRYHW